MRTLRRMFNPLSTATTRWWCHSALRRFVLRHRRDVRPGPAAALRRPGLSDRAVYSAPPHRSELSTVPAVCRPVNGSSSISGVPPRVSPLQTMASRARLGPAGRRRRAAQSATRSRPGLERQCR